MTAIHALAPLSVTFFVDVAKEALDRCVEVDEKKVEFNYSYIHANPGFVYT